MRPSRTSIAFVIPPKVLVVMNAISEIINITNDIKFKIKRIKFEKKIMGVGGIFIGTLALIFAIVIVMEIKERFF